MVVQVLLKNRAKVLYCTRIKGAQTPEDKQAIQVTQSLSRKDRMVAKSHQLHRAILKPRMRFSWNSLWMFLRGTNVVDAV